MKNREYVPEKCWVGEGQKICYASEEDARGAAVLVEQEHGLAVGALTVYKCEFGEHWHLASVK
jgi:hypothetical protein